MMSCQTPGMCSPHGGCKQPETLYATIDRDELKRLQADSEELARLRSQPVRQVGGESPKLTVWYGSMPESNGKSNWTAILHSGDITTGMTIERSECPDRVRYEADRVRYLIGELKEEPLILDYDADKHSGYVAPAALAPAAVVRVDPFPAPSIQNKPCGECHIQPGETCDICHAKEPTGSRQTHTDCRSEEGITVGLIDGIINSARLLKGRTITGAVREALDDLRSDEDFAAIGSMATVVLPKRSPWQTLGPATGFKEVGWKTALAEVARLNRRAIPEGLLERTERHLANWLELNACECEGFHVCGRNEVKADRDELRALLGKS